MYFPGLCTAAEGGSRAALFHSEKRENKSDGKVQIANGLVALNDPHLMIKIL